MDDPPTACAMIWTQCLTAASTYAAAENTGRVNDYWYPKQIKELADTWFREALKIGEQAAEEQNRERGGYEE